MKRLVVGILAHVDSGKTTLSESLLYLSGNIRQPGRVDHGDAFLDNFALEKERGITIFSKQAVLNLPESQITLLDTPGHVDFSPEMERTLQVLDYAVIVISATDGIQSHTETLWHLLTVHHIPTFIFINKTDLPGMEHEELMEQLRSRLSEGCIDFSKALVDNDTGSLDGLDFESIAMCDESLLDKYLKTGEISHDLVVSSIYSGHIFPCFFGSALKLQGVKQLLMALGGYTLPPASPAKFGAKVFKISRDSSGTRLTHIKITGGCMRVRSSLTVKNRNGSVNDEKINQIRIYSGSKFQLVEEAQPGMVCAVTGPASTFPGQGLGIETDSEFPMLSPVLTYRAELPAGVDAHSALQKFRQLEEEEPQLHVVWNEALAEIHVQLMGQVQLEIFQAILRERFDMAVSFGRGNILYKETIAETVEGVGHFEPLRHYAEVHLILDPQPAGSGLAFDTICSEDELDRNWQRLILTHLEEKTHIGVLTGSPITDMKVILAAGRAHEKHTEGGDFRQATYRALRQGLRSAQSILLEPWYAFRMNVPYETVGRAMSDLQRMGARFEPPQTTGDNSVITGSAPVIAMQDYQLELNGYTHGKGRLACSLKGYEPCHNAEEVIASVGYDCDADVENTADSVFCSHGSGNVVKWNLVPEHMHLSTVLAPQALPEEEIKRRTENYRARVATDKELIAIFEKTYGPVKQERKHYTIQAKTTEFKPHYKSSKPAPVFSGPEYLLVDGYNIIFAWDELKSLAKENIDSARERLVDILCNYQGYVQCNLILVFDAYKVKHNPGTIEKVHNISVVYTKEAETADMYIEKTTHKLAGTCRIRVATSDNLEQMIIFGHGALRVSAEAFRVEVNQAEAAIREILNQYS